MFLFLYLSIYLSTYGWYAMNYNFMQMEWCRLKSSRVVLVLTSYRGFRISNWNGQEVAYENLFETRRGAYEQRFARGIATVDNVVCVGTSEGNVSVLYVPPTGCDVVFSRHLQGHSAPITALCPCTLNQVASSDESGMIIVWSNPVISAESKFVINEPGSFPCQCLCHWRGILVAGFSNGTIRLYNTETGRKMAEIAAHGRSVTGVDTAQDSGLVSTVYSGTTLIQYIIGTEDVCDVLLSGLTRTVLGETKGVLIKEVSSFHGCS
jgi:WD40 repeat protein